jgi:hypothetical protein
MVEHARRFALGRAVYVEPGLDFAPFPYPPLFPLAGALALGVVGDGASHGLVAVRLVSVLATVALLALVAVSAVRTGKPGPERDSFEPAALALLGAGIVAAGVGFAGWFLDLARVDGLTAALTVAAGLAAARARTRTALVAAGVLAALAVLTKQTALLPCALLVLPLARCRRHVALGYGLAFALPLGAAAIVLETTSGGWASFTVLDLLAGSPWHDPAVLGFWRESLSALFPLVALGGLVLAHGALRRTLLRDLRAEPCVPTLALGLAASAWLGRAHEGGFDNTLLPLVVAAALVAPRLVALVGPCAALRRGLAALAIPVLAVAGGDPRVRVPDADDRARAEAAVQALAALPAPAFVPDAPDLAERAGHPPAVHAMAIVDLLKSGEQEAAAAFVARLEEALTRGDYGAVVLDEPWDLPALHERYVPAGEVAVPAPRSGAPRVPRFVYRRR